MQCVSRVSREVEVVEERPTLCAECGSTEIKRWGWLVRTIHDLKLSAIGIKRWVVRYSFPRYICWRCRKTFHKFAVEPGKYGPTIRAYVAYQVIELQLSQRAVARSLVQIFNVPVSAEAVNRLKADEAGRYTGAYQALLEKIVRGPVVHADETKAKVTGKQGYVWAFANSEEVVFAFSENREASTPLRVLKGFDGVLVSDFYSAYDAIACSQQKCLIHLMRDINEDLCKQPFNEEMKEMGHALINNEYGWLWLLRDGTPTELTRRVYEHLLGADAKPQDRLALNAYLLGGLTEFWRAHRIYAGVLHFVYLTACYPGAYTCDNFEDVAALKLEPHFADYVREAFKPLGVYLNFWQSTLPPESVRRIAVMLINDAHEAASGKLALTLETAGGEELARREVSFAVPALGQQTYAMDFRAPRTAGACVLKAVAYAAGQQEPTISRRKVSIQAGAH